ncbi:hypothetical protein LAZ40_02460, partial [Cereibacter sphaeroides]|nr:hypothetical protein [Cereibacter sphaeroides]
GPSDRRVRFVGEDGYLAAGGRLTRDLFSDAVFFEDAGLLDRLFAEKLEGEAHQQNPGWAWIETVDDTHFGYDAIRGGGFERVYRVEGELSGDEAAEYDELADLANAEALDEDGEARLAALEAKMEGDYNAEQKALAGAAFYVSYDGALQCVEGLIRAEDVPAAVEAGLLQPRQDVSSATDAPAPKSLYSGALVEDMKAVRLAAIQTALLDRPDMVLDLLAFGLSLASGATTTVFDLQPGRPMNRPKETDGLTFAERLAHPPASHEAWSRPDLRCDDPVAAFRAFAAQGKKARNAAITEGIARTLPYGATSADFFAMIETDSGASIRKVWTPTAVNFFGRMSGAWLDNLFANLLDAEPGDIRVKGFRDKKKKEKAEAMERLFSDAAYQAASGVTSEQNARIAAWIPDCI